MSFHKLAIGMGILGLLFSTGCSTTDPSPVVYYQPAYRTTPPLPVYGRVVWSHLPQPIKNKNPNHAPYLLPEVQFDLPNSTLEEAIEALAQTMGYRWHYPNRLARRKVRIRMEGTVEEVLAEIGRQAKVQATFDHERKLVRVIDSRMSPKLPGKW